MLPRKRSNKSISENNDDVILKRKQNGEERRDTARDGGRCRVQGKQKSLRTAAEQDENEGKEENLYHGIARLSRSQEEGGNTETAGESA